jgi:uncharacterized protein (DUF488 family)
VITIFTVGHSTHPIDRFVEMLRAHEIELLIDVRTLPRSRRNPHFNRDALAASLSQIGIAYTHMPELGGLRVPRPDSINTAWKNAAFRGYADHMQTPGFSNAIDQLTAAAMQRRSTIMCAEALPSACHRSLISDALMARGVAVEHILGTTKREQHRYTPFARIEGGNVSYPGLA